MTRCLIALGSNLGDRSNTLRSALREITRLTRVRLLARSRWHETVPIGGPPGQQLFLNGVALLDTGLPASQLLSHLLRIESLLGRERADGFSDGIGPREMRWSPRTVDLDLLLYGNQCCESESLQLPHPRMSFRRFVLEPAVEIAGWLPHPICGSILARLLWQLNTAGDYVAIMATGVRASARQACQWMAHELVMELGCHWWKHEGPIGPFHFPEGILVYGLHLQGGIPLKDHFQPRGAVQPDVGDEEKLTNGDSLRCDVPVTFRDGKYTAMDPQAGGCGYRESLRAYPKLVIAWEKRVIKDRMDELDQGQGRPSHQPGEPPFTRGPLASILTTDGRQALTEALAAIRSIWPAGRNGRNDF